MLKAVQEMQESLKNMRTDDGDATEEVKEAEDESDDEFADDSLM